MSRSAMRSHGRSHRPVRSCSSSRGKKHPPTNLQVVTTRADGRKRSYQFELSIAETTLADSYFVVRFAYPGDEIERRRAEAAARGAEREGALIEQTFDLHHAYGARNWRFSAQGSIDPEPEAVFDDGKETTFRFAGNREIPAIYLINSDGSESLVPKDVRGELVAASSQAEQRSKHEQISKPGQLTLN